jgi:hypothetical protein
MSPLRELLRGKKRLKGRHFNIPLQFSDPVYSRSRRL